MFRDSGHNPAETAVNFFYRHMQQSLNINITPGYEKYTFAYFKGGRNQAYAIIEIIRCYRKKFMRHSELCDVYQALYGHPLDDKTVKQMLNQGGNEYALKLFRGCKEFFIVRKDVHSIDFEIGLADPTYDYVPVRERAQQIQTILMACETLKHTYGKQDDATSMSINYLVNITESQIKKYNIPSDCGELYNIEQIIDEETEEEALKRCGMKTFQ